MANDSKSQKKSSLRYCTCTSTRVLYSSRRDVCEHDRACISVHMRLMLGSTGQGNHEGGGPSIMNYVEYSSRYSNISIK